MDIETEIESLFGSGESEFIDSLSSAEPYFKATQSDLLALASLERDTTDITNGLQQSRPLLPNNLISSLEDNRQWRPDSSTRPPAAPSAADSQVGNVFLPGRDKREFDEEEARLRKLEAPFRRKLGFNQVGFTQPDMVSICAKRRRRREVMSAFGFLGRLYFKRYRRSFWSLVRC